jgi:phosphoglucosamine mutase
MLYKLFGADGIRGVVGYHPLTDEDVARLGRVIAAWLRQHDFKPALLIASDTRESCQQIKTSLIDGLSYGGVTVVDIGILPTAGVSYLLADTALFNAGVMISGSHNPIDENGIKIFGQNGQKINDRQEDEIESTFFGKSILPRELRPSTYLADFHLVDRYMHSLKQEFVDLDWSRLRVLIDCSNGALSQIGPRVLHDLHVPYSIINAEPNGSNINFKAGSEYIRRNPQQVVTQLVSHGADIAFAVDGDADRVVLVDRYQRVYDGDMLLAMLATQMQQAHQLQQDIVVTTQMSNTGLTHYLNKKNIQVFKVRNGDKYISEMIVANDLTLGGEEIGHVVLHTDRTRLTGDGLRTALMLLSYLTSTRGGEISDLAPGMVKLPQIKASAYTGQSGGPVPTKIAGLIDMLSRIESNTSDLTHPIECRPASTEPVYRIVLEAYTTPVKQLAEIARTIAQYIQSYLNCTDKPIDILNCKDGGLL